MLASRFGLRAGEAVLGGHLNCPSTVVIAIPAGAIARQEMILDCGSLHNFRAKLSAHAKASAHLFQNFQRLSSKAAVICASNTSVMAETVIS